MPANVLKQGRQTSSPSIGIHQEVHGREQRACRAGREAHVAEAPQLPIEQQPDVVKRRAHNDQTCRRQRPAPQPGNVLLRVHHHMTKVQPDQRRCDGRQCGEHSVRLKRCRAPIGNYVGFSAYRQVLVPRRRIHVPEPQYQSIDISSGVASRFSVVKSSHSADNSRHAAACRILSHSRTRARIVAAVPL